MRQEIKVAWIREANDSCVVILRLELPWLWVDEM